MLENLKSMMIKPSLLLILVSLLGACASKERFNTPQKINEECNMEMQAARTAVRLREKGKPETFMQETLPPIKPESSRLLHNLYDIVNETYQHTALNEVVYPTYRFELCMRQLQNKPYPTSLAVIEPSLIECQQQFRMESTKQSTECILQAIDELNPGDLVDPNRKVTRPEPEQETQHESSP